MVLSNSNRNIVNIDRMIDDLLKSNQSEKLLLVVPTNRKVRQLKKLFISQSPLKVVSQLNIETLWTLATKIYKTENSFIKLESPTANVLINQCFKIVKPKTFQKYNESLPFGTQEAIKNYFSKLKENGIYPELFKSQLNLIKETDRAKAEDLLRIFELYVERTKKIKLLEIGDIFHGLSNFSKDGILTALNNLFPQIEKIIFYEFDYLRFPELNFISMFSELQQFEIFVKSEFNKFNPKIFGYMIETIVQLKKMGLREISESQPEISIFKDFINQNLFRNKKLSPKIFSNQIQKLTAFNRQHEVETIAKEIKILLLEKSVDISRICIVFNRIANYTNIIRDVFSVFQIPINLTDRFSLNQASPVVAIINILEILESNFNIKNIQKALSSKLFNHNVNLNNLISFSRKYKITSNYNRWQSSIKAAMDSDEESKIDFEKLDEDLYWIKNLVLPFERRLSKNDALKELDNLLISLEIVQNILKLDSSTAEKNIRAIESFYKNTEMMLKLLDDETPDSKYNINSLLEILRSIANNTRYNIKESAAESILVSSVDEIRGLSFDYVFIGGLSNNDFPTKYSNDLISFDENELIKTKHNQKERFRFYQAITSWKKQLFLSYPQFEGETELVESSFLTELEEIIEIHEVDQNKYLDKIFTRNDENKLLGHYPENPDLLKLISQKEQIASTREKISIDELKKSEAFNEFNGHLLIKHKNEDEYTLDLIAEKLQTRKEHQYSASEMETFSRCPFKYFLQHILNIKVEKEPTEFIESIELGIYLHKILFHFYIELKKRNLELRNCSDSIFNEAKDLIFNIARQIIPNELLTSPFAFYDIEKIFGINGNEKDSILYMFISFERTSEGFSPKYFEVSFGEIKNESEDSIHFREAVAADKVLLKGKIDRVDIDEEQKKYKIIDYKLSGRKPTGKDIEDGLALQLPIYAFAAEALLAREFGSNLQPDNLHIFSLKYMEGKFGINEYFPGKNSFNKDLILLAMDKVKSNAKKIIKGEFPLTSLDDYSQRICRNCDFGSVCRINELR